MRFNERLNVTFNYSKTSNSTSISPMLLIPFIENSFKHGYINNLSILDLLFNEGTNALNYLETQQLP